MSKIRIVPATETDLLVILDMIHALAEYEKLAHVVTATEKQLRETLFNTKPAAEVLLAYCEGECAAFAVRDLFHISGPARALFGGLVCEASSARQWDWVGPA